jgi:amidophosphoribosyltransferase
MSTREEMVAHERTIDEICEHLNADSLAYVSLDGVYEAIGTPAEDHCDACFTGRYPLGEVDGGGKYALEQLATVAATAR